MRYVRLLVFVLPHPLPPSVVLQSDISVTESERSFKDKKKFFESGFKETGPKPKRKRNVFPSTVFLHSPRFAAARQFKYINEHELFQMKQEEGIIKNIVLYSKTTPFHFPLQNKKSKR